MKLNPTTEQIRSAVREEFRGALALHPDHADAVAGGHIAPRAGWDDDEEPPDYCRRGSLAIVSICGALAQRGGWWWDGHESIRKRCERALADPQVGALVLEIRSPGGVVAGCWDNVQAVQAAKARSGKRVFAYAREHAYSAAYAWAMVADEVHVPTSGGVGSIGVLTILCDESKAWEEIGVKFLVVRSGERKARGMGFEGIDEQTVTAEQARVDRLAGQFFDLVSGPRHLKTATIRSFEGDTFDGAIAVEKGLADSVISWDAFLVKAEEAGRKWKMKGIATALGLASDATEGEIERAAASLKKAHDDEKASHAATASKLADVATAHALRTGRITAGEVESQRALICKAPVDGAAALMARAEMAALPAPSVEAKTTAGGAPPLDTKAEHEFSSWAKLDAPSLARAYGALMASDANGPARLASVDKDLYQRARTAWQNHR